MKIKQTTPHARPKKIILITIIVLFILACGYTGFALKQDIWPFNTAGSVTQAEKDAANNFPTTSPKTDAPAVDSSSKNNDPQTPNQSNDQVPVSPTLTATITQLEEKDSVIYFSAAITGTSDSGTCVVNFTNPNDKPVTKQVTATVKGSSVACGPIQISNLEFSYLGQWSVDFNFYTGGKQVSTSGIIKIR